MRLSGFTFDSPAVPLNNQSMAKKKTSKKPNELARRSAADLHRQREKAQMHAADLEQVASARQLFWENVVREMLTGLSMLQTEKPEIFDGRIAVLTHAGERIPIGEVAPMFACSIVGGSSWQRAASVAVECTIFRIKTPAGEMYTLPIHEIRGMHAMTPELIKQLEQQAMQQLTDSDGRPSSDRPFGFAAFTSPFRNDGLEQPSLFGDLEEPDELGDEQEPDLRGMRDQGRKT